MTGSSLPHYYYAYLSSKTSRHVLIGSIAVLILWRLAHDTVFQKKQPLIIRYENHILESSHPRCSPRIGPNTTVLLVRGPTWQQFHGPSKSVKRGGEAYVFASLDWALQQLGVTVVQTEQSLEELGLTELQKYNRIIANGLEWPLERKHSVVCRHRPLHFWGNWKGTDGHPYVPKQVLSPFPDDYNTFLGFFMHAVLLETPAQQRRIPATTRHKQGLIVGKIPELFTSERVRPVLEALIENGFVLYSVCKAPHHCGLPSQVLIPPAPMGPVEYAQFMSEMAFLIGFGDPIISPSPLEGLAHGAAWLNPHKEYTSPTREQAARDVLDKEPYWHWTHPTPLNTQHNPLALLGAPYVYNIHLENVTQVLAAAHHAVQYRFQSYVPPEFRPEAMIARACAMLEDDSICECPYHNSVDCRASSYMRNPPHQE
ncbi:mannosyl (alpha-1,6-)-glycoprotein beta-1,6-N-acetyl-glucosaminyltransferase, isozyme B [Seminavis robusta]|uniref:alpha-1,6-mannosyl-glycoprotein 6-beta-N-acetylglucosaminyltransferase n=1 Tax=Seminavis robusta TaxID=568900 RepID=A0A9N8HH27_9STRA|nr:mannosyl (alpha-1,6-)-glycoprotein beta-1,6-N-acetyl-glucosaminyltransferase, isozyme B [Seminavis robusta]|eukprot:Sro515_g158240.1 mannosyl (alpha-1,6-)-glycoprotein beta-1,6-N-acetyl-glucosaminyltransferase, isozyme B (427) ;mRNA; r:17213-18493